MASRIQYNSVLIVACGFVALACAPANGQERDQSSQGPTMSRAVQVKTRYARGMRGMTATGKVNIAGDFNSDSYDPDDPNKSTGGFYDPLKPGEDGFVGTTSKVLYDMNITGAAAIIGGIGTGAPGVLKGLSGDSVVGSRAYVQAGNTGIEEGHFRDDLNVSFPEPKVPFTPPLLPSLFLPEVVNGTNYNYVFKDGNYTMNDWKMVGMDKAIVTGHAVLYVKDSVDITAQTPIVIAPGGSLDIYVGGTASFGGGGVVNATGYATNFNFYGLKTCTAVGFSGNSSLVGGIYAPNARLNLTGTSDFYGESVSRDISIVGNFRFHHDESMGRQGKRYIPIRWREM